MIFHSVAEVVKAGKGPSILKSTEAEANTVLKDEVNDWCPKTMEEIEADLKAVPPEISDVINEAIKEIRDAVPIPQRERRKRKRNQPEGYDFDLDLFRDREFDRMWTDTHRVYDNAKAIRIGVNVAINGNEGFEDLKWRGAVACALVAMYEEYGKQTELTAFIASRPTFFGKYEPLTQIRLKEQHQRFDRNLLGVTLCDPSFLRRVLFPAALKKSEQHWSLRGWQSRTMTAEEQADVDFVIDVDIRYKQRAIEFVKGAISASTC